MGLGEVVLKLCSKCKFEWQFLSKAKAIVAHAQQPQASDIRSGRCLYICAGCSCVYIRTCMCVCVWIKLKSYILHYVCVRFHSFCSIALHDEVHHFARGTNISYKYFLFPSKHSWDGDNINIGRVGKHHFTLGNVAQVYVLMFLHCKAEQTF